MMWSQASRVHAILRNIGMAVSRAKGTIHTQPQPQLWPQGQDFSCPLLSKILKIKTGLDATREHCRHYHCVMAYHSGRLSSCVQWMHLHICRGKHFCESSLLRFGLFRLQVLWCAACALCALWEVLMEFIRKFSGHHRPPPPANSHNVLLQYLKMISATWPSFLRYCTLGGPHCWRQVGLGN